MQRETRSSMRMKLAGLLLAVVAARGAMAQGTVPTFTHTAEGKTYTLVGADPAKGGTTTIPAVLAPVTLTFESKKVAGKPFALDAKGDVPRVLRSPVFAKFAFGSSGTTQYGDALLRSTFPKASDWHTLLGKPEMKPVTVTIPAGYGYVLTSKSEGAAAAVVDIEFLQKEIFKQLPKQDGKLVLAITHNTTFYAMGDATVCCAWGTH